ncbi:MAG TPA: VOC family protein [Longimicrobium sp.]|nr:VOC family protein [Longimicrobium sp.]
MHDPPAPPTSCETVHPSLFVRDLAASIEFYTKKLGFTLGFSSGEMAGVNLDRVQVFLQRVPGEVAPGYVFFVVDDVDALYEYHRANGVDVQDPPADREYGIREYELRDADGHSLGFGQHIFTAGPAIEVERVDVPVRLEKRLAALLEDLARRKRMTVGECLEETLLHTFEPLPTGGVASPHTRSDHAHIAALREKHGIDYDSHGSYRFVEKP